jgi:NADH-quinone oxidoreductase subunit A
MLADFGHLLIFILFGFSFGVLNLLVLSPLLRFKSGDKQQKIAYECGMEPVGSVYVPTDIRFYLFALLFVIFDVESLFLFPWAIVFKDLGWIGLADMLVFIGIIMFGLFYTWKRGGLHWETPT